MMIMKAISMEITTPLLNYYHYNLPGWFSVSGSEGLTLSKQGRPIGDYGFDGDNDDDKDDNEFDDNNNNRTSTGETLYNATDYLQDSSKAIQRNFAILIWDNVKTPSWQRYEN